MAILWEGNHEDSLLAKLQELQELTQIDSIINPHQKVEIVATTYGKGQMHWTINQDVSECKTKTIAKGKKFNKFCQALKDVEKMFDTGTTSMYVLAYADTASHKTYDGQYQTRWFKINPFSPYQLNEKTGAPEFTFEDILCNESEYRILMETRLAFKVWDKIYALSPEALASVGRLLDARTAFRNLNDHMLGSALVIADALSERTSLKGLCRQTTGKVNILLNLVGSRYEYIPQQAFFEEVFRNVAQFGVYHINKWVISEDKTVVDIVYMDGSSFKKGFLVTASDFGGIPMTVSAYGSFLNESKVILNRATMKHNKTSVKMGVGQMFEEAQAAFERFERLREMQEVVYFNAKDYNKTICKIKKLIGTERFKAANLPITGYFSCLELAALLAERLYANIRDDQNLMCLIWSLIQEVLDKNGVSLKKNLMEEESIDDCEYAIVADKREV